MTCGTDPKEAARENFEAERWYLTEDTGDKGDKGAVGG